MLAAFSKRLTNQYKNLSGEAAPVVIDCDAKAGDRAGADREAGEWYPASAGDSWRERRHVEADRGNGDGRAQGARFRGVYPVCERVSGL